MAFVNERKQNVLDNCTIDYERNAVLTRGSSQNWYIRVVGATPFTLEWKGEKIEFGALYKFHHEGEKKTMQYFVERCIYPESLLPFKKEIIEMVVEALSVYGISYGTDDGTEIYIKISPSLGSLQMEPIQDMPRSPKVSETFH